MIALSKEKIEQILNEETAKKEDATAILRSIYTRYMRLYEKYFADIDALNDDKIAELAEYHEVTKSLVKYYYMDIPLDTCTKIREFEDKYSDHLLGPGWHEYLLGSYKDFREKNKSEKQSEESVKAEYTKQVLAYFYDVMDYVFREEFGTGSQTAKDIVSGITGLLFGKQ